MLSYLGQCYDCITTIGGIADVHEKHGVVSFIVISWSAISIYFFIKHICYAANGTSSIKPITATTTISICYFSRREWEIAFVRSSGGGNTEIYVMNADGTEQTNISNNPNSHWPSWSPDGTKIAFWSIRDNPGGAAVAEIYVMNADGSGQTRLTNNRCCVTNDQPDWGPAADSQPPVEDITAPVLTVPEDMTVEATGPDGAQVSFEQEPSATDDVDGPVDVACDYDSSDTFPIGETVVTCSAEDAAGNSAEETFTVTVQDTTSPDVEITEAIDRRNREVADGGTTPTPYIRIAFEATDAVGIDRIECSLDGQPFTSCGSPVVYDRLSRGAHEVTVRAIDDAGNVGEDEFTWTVGANPPATPPGRQ